jgi:hypothetical protein
MEWVPNGAEKYRLIKAAMLALGINTISCQVGKRDHFPGTEEIIQPKLVPIYNRYFHKLRLSR